MTGKTNTQSTQPFPGSSFRRHRNQHAVAYLTLALSALMMFGLHLLEDQSTHTGEPDHQERRASAPQKPTPAPIPTSPVPQPPVNPIPDTLFLITPNGNPPSSEPTQADSDSTDRLISDVPCQPQTFTSIPQAANPGRTAEAERPPQAPRHPLWWRLSFLGAAALHAIGYLILAAPYLNRRSSPEAGSPVLSRTEPTPTDSNDKYDEQAIQHMIDDGCANVD